MTDTLNGKGVHHTGGLPAPVSTPQVTATDHGRIEGVVQVLIMLAVAGMAGAASFRHVHDWTMHNSPAGTGDWFGWANAMVSELIPLAAGLKARRRHRRYGTAGIYPIALILGAVALSLTGQFAEAKPGLSGLLVSAVPALGFLALVKLVLSTPHAKNGHAAVPADVAPDISPATTPEPVPVSAPLTAPAAPPAAAPAATAAAEEISRPEVPVHLLPSARFALTQHEQTTGRPITADELAARMSVTTDIAGRLLATLTEPSDPRPNPVPVRINGVPVTGGAR